MLKRSLFICSMIASAPLLNGCAAGSATAGYSMRSQSADEVGYKARKEIIDEAVDKAVSKSQEYADKTFVRKDGK